MENLTIFDLMYEDYKITKPIRLIEFFSGIGAQAKALKNLGANFTHWHTCEWAYPSILAYNEIHHNELDGYGKDFSSGMSKDEIVDFLYNKGISANYNEPMKLEQIKRLSEEKLRKIYNAIQSTKDLVNIQQVKGKDLEIVDTNKYEYILTYSFPCQDLSLAGKGAGMSRDSGTRSGMLWEVERILDECNVLGELPRILLLENVPQIIGQNNIKDFQSWRDKLESLGYSNYIQVLNAKDYGIPQNRERAFMISILGEYNYRFPSKIKLEKKLKDMLEENVDEKYYLSDKQIDQVINWNAQQEPLETLGKECSPTLTTRSGAYAAGMVLTSNLNQDDEKIVGQELLKIKNDTKQGYLMAEDGDGIDIGGAFRNHRGTVRKQKSQTLTTNADKGVVVKNEPRVIGGIGEKKSNGGTQWYQQDRIYDDNIAISVTTSFNPYYKVSPTVIEKEKYVNKKIKETLENNNGELFEYADLYNAKPINNGISPTISCSCGNATGVGSMVVNNNLRIRKLTGKECYRLMGFSDEDCDNARKVLSENMIYHVSGDSICVNVLMAIFGQFFENKRWEEIWEQCIKENISKEEI